MVGASVCETVILRYAAALKGVKHSERSDRPESSPASPQAVRGRFTAPTTRQLGATSR